MVTIAGPFSFTVCRPPSTSRVTWTLSPSITSLEAKVPCGQPSSAASIWPVWLQSSSIACLPMMTRPGFSASTMPLRILATASGSTGAVDLHQDAAVGAHGERGADGLGRLLRADRNRDDLGRLAGFLQPDRLFDRDLVERIHRHLDVGKLDARAVRLDADFDVVVDDPFDGHQDLHVVNLLLGPGFGPGIGAAHPNSRLIRGQRCRGGYAGFQCVVTALLDDIAQSLTSVRRSRNTRSSVPKLDRRNACLGWRA